MHKQDFWTLIVAAVAVSMASLSSLLDSFRGPVDNLGAYRWLLIAGPLMMIACAGYGRWAASGGTAAEVPAAPQATVPSQTARSASTPADADTSTGVGGEPE